ncbi:hypothetical protein MMYC01_206678 [Madurella mycetomatis]|uniref:Velvet domain-containing protein n=1 Tax=Madurella mycetomatis TaxID=100816 RepID=A0A175W078_9PEZI|nr:hypothetical protein MMYC01_206678 [Madurella mycetomatis]
MSAAVDFAPHEFGRHHLLDGMARPHAYHDPYASRHAHYTQEQQLQQPPQTAQLPRLPPMATMISPAAASSQPSVLPTGRDAPYPGGKPGYYSDYATPSPVGQTPPQLPGPNNEAHHIPRRAVDIRRSPALSSTASDRSSDEIAHEMRLRQMSNLHDHHGQGQISRPYLHQPSPRLRGNSFHQHDTALLPVLTKGPAPSASYSSPVISNGRPLPHQQQPQLPRSPPSTQPSASPRQEAKSMSISNLLSSENNTPNTATNSPSPSSLATPKQQQQQTLPPHRAHSQQHHQQQPPASSYRITVRQQPFAARSCGFGERDRRVIDPPPIVQLTIHDASLSADDHARRLRHQFSVVHCSIWDEKGVRDMSSMPEDFRQQRRLMGTLVASPFVGQDENGEEGCFFCFPDLSCRTPGVFRLKFALVVLDPARMHMGERSAIVATAMSEVFQVYNAKDFPGMKASTLLTKRLKEQGCLISIKKGNEKREGSAGQKGKVGGNGGGGGGDDEDDEDGMEEEDEEGEMKRARKRLRRSG